MDGSDKTPLLERPPSSLIDVSEFSFAKPASSRKPFSLRNVSNQHPISTNPIETAPASNELLNRQVIVDLPWNRSDTPLSSRSVVKDPKPGNPVPARQPFHAQHAHQSAPTKGPASVNPDQIRIEHNEQSPVEHEDGVSVSRLHEPKEGGGHNEASGNTSSAGKPPQGVADFYKTNEVGPALPRDASATLERRHDRGSHEATILLPPRVPLRPVNTQRTSKRQGHHEKEAPKKQMLVVGGKKNTQLSENDLFEQLIVRIRQREESEQNATSIRRKIESENRALKEANQALQERVNKNQVQLVKASSESNGQRALLEQLKAKMTTYRGVIHELGREYDKVRAQTMDLKETAASLGHEKVEIQATLGDLKLQTSKQTAMIEGQKERLASSNGSIALLKEALEHSEKRSDLLKAQLMGDKRRIGTLEAYIQRESESQARCLTVVKKEQRKMAEKIDTMCDRFKKACFEAQDSILTKLGPEVERCAASVEDLKKQCSAETMNAEEFTNSVQKASSRFEYLAGQFTSDLDRTNETSNNVFQALQEGLQSIESNLGPYSSLMKQLASNESSYSSLQRHVQIIEPVLGNLGDSVKAVETTEANLIQGLQKFSQMLSEARMPAGNPVLEKEVAAKFAENTQLQLQLQQALGEKESLQMELERKVSENIQIQHDLTETTSNGQENKVKLARLEMEKTALRGEFVIHEQRIREELSTAGTRSQDEMKGMYEHKIGELEMVNARLERETHELTSQLANNQSSLDESKKLAEKSRLETNLKLQDTRMQIEELERTCSEYADDAKASEAKSQMTKSSEASLNAEKEALVQQLHQLTKNSEELQTQLAQVTQSQGMKERAAFDAAEKLLRTEIELAFKDQELKLTKHSVAVVESRSAALEKNRAEADSEILSLLQRAQEAESWQMTIREGVSKIMEVPPNEPFEVTWRKVENSLQRLLAQRTTHDPFCVNALKKENVVTVDDRIDPHEPRKCGTGNDFATELSAMLSHAKENAETGEQLPHTERHVSIVGDCVDPPRDSVVDRSHITPFSSLHDRAAPEYDDLSVFNDVAELDMLMLCTPDPQGSFAPRTTVPGEESEETSKLPAISEKRTKTTKQLELMNVDETEQSGPDPGKLGATLADQSIKPEQTAVKRKAVSFEETHAMTQSKHEKTRRLSDATDHSSGVESDSKEIKRSQKRTYSRLRQSVAQEDSPDSQTRVQSDTKALTGDLPQAPIKSTDDADSAPKPTKRSRKTGDDPQRRLSPKGLALGSSRTEGTSQAAKARARNKRRTRGKLSHLSKADRTNHG
ncbi:hypothetical protein MYU51_005007 [Penicillium brevicompactum]|uniref:uncharacterized protein n=1 Tax=Penicillium brevicompactum TaxID=5074 RepID=UPI00253F985F|nr:uncharacterized protein N7506_006945 [Penicillium brevicompactum]KAJ5333162.1 hypothetical protein N7506_006945 [Penicillium brevicompactum]